MRRCMLESGGEDNVVVIRCGSLILRCKLASTGDREFVSVEEERPERK